MCKEVIEITSDDTPLACGEGRRGAIINPGAIGDNLLTLPLAAYMQKTLALDAVDFIGNADYIEYLQGRSCISNTRSINSMPLYNLFVDPDEFVLDEGQKLAKSLCSYEWIVSFLGEPSSNFENNLIASIYTSHPAHISILPLIPDDNQSTHISRFYIEKFCQANDLEQTDFKFNQEAKLIQPIETDIENGKMLARSLGVDASKKEVVIHPGSGGQYKCWNIDNISAVARNLKAAGHEIVFLLGPAEIERFSAEQKDTLSAIGRLFSSLPLRQTMQIISSCDCFLGNDSGISHLSATLGTPTVVLFGPTNPDIYRPIGPHVEVVTAPADSFSGPDPQNQTIVTEIVSKMLGD